MQQPYPYNNKAKTSFFSLTLDFKKVTNIAKLENYYHHIIGVFK